ncbi:MAG: ribonuclease P protein component [Desulfobacteraceae bacterium 4572_130]|nr:MAG: ribonuclease P protein component [Desulfobacteraceae bacterium 4572_130]
MGIYSFPKTERLLRRADFLKLSRLGEKIQTRFFIALILEGITKHNRIGITVSRKVGKAVKRNRIKRIIREYYRNRKNIIIGNNDINIIARKHTAFLKNKTIIDELNRLFKEIAKIL